MATDYIVLAIVAIVGFGGGFYLLAQAKKYRRTHGHSDSLNHQVP